MTCTIQSIFADLIITQVESNSPSSGARKSPTNQSNLSCYDSTTDVSPSNKGSMVEMADDYVAPVSDQQAQSLENTQIDKYEESTENPATGTAMAPQSMTSLTSLAPELLQGDLTLHLCSGIVYRGTVCDGFMDGDGSFLWRRDGTEYEGQVQKNRMTGQGKIRWKYVTS